MATKILAPNPKTTIGVIIWGTGDGSRATGPVDAAFAEASHPARQRWDLAIEDCEVAQPLIAAVGRLPRQAGRETVRQVVLPIPTPRSDRVIVGPIMSLTDAQ